MEVKDYCSNVDMELTLWKAKIFDVIRKADQLGSGELEKGVRSILRKNIPKIWDF